MTYVDNLVFAASDASTAEDRLVEARRRLHDVWILTLPPSSVDLLLPAGAPSAPLELVLVASMRALGFVVAASGGCTACWDSARGAAHAALWRHLSAAHRAGFAAQRAQIVERFVWSVIRHRAALWVPTAALRTALSGSQRWCISQAFALPRYPSDQPGAYVMRRGRHATTVVAGSVPLGVRAARLAWPLHQHVIGGEMPMSWAALLMLVRDEAWLRDRRVQHGSESVCVGRIGARAPREATSTHGGRRMWSLCLRHAAGSKDDV